MAVPAYRDPRPAVARLALAGLPGGAPPCAEPGETILLVEDDELVRRLARRLLESLGYAVVAASDLAGAAPLAAAHTEVGLVLCDLVLPDGRGPELEAAVRAVRPDLRWLFTSGYCRGAVDLDGELPADAAFIAKPFTLGELGTSVRRLLDA